MNLCIWNSTTRLTFGEILFVVLPLLFYEFVRFFFRYQSAFHGVNLSARHNEAMKEYFRQPIVDTFDIRICMSKSVRHVIDFAKDKETDLYKIGN